MSQISNRPEDVIKNLDDLIESARHLKQEIRWVHSVTYGRNPGPSSEHVRTSGVSDPTGELVANQDNIRRHYRRAVADIHRAVKFLDRSAEGLKKGVDAADRYEDNRLLPREYDQPRVPPMVSPEEHLEARRAQARRTLNGRGFGES